MDQFFNRKQSKVDVAYQKKSTSDKPRSQKKLREGSLETAKRSRNSHSRVERSFGYSTDNEFKWDKKDHLAETPNTQIDKELLREQRRSEVALYSIKVCLAVFAQRPETIVKAYFLKKQTPQFSKLLSWLAAQRKSYHVVDEAEMQKITGTKHHEGACLIVKKRQSMTLVQYLAKQQHCTQDLLLMLSGPQNPYNVGAVVRTAAFFNSRAVVADATFSLDNGIIARIATGASELLQLVTQQDLQQSLTVLLEQGYQVIVLNNSQGQSIKDFVQQSFTYSSKIVVVMGEVSPQIMENAACHCINVAEDDGASLNIAALFAIIGTQWWRQS